ncbi:hypothetical protein BN2476_680042 [Paraburkholderia piptadeniae]|uniref:Uncharacterized protein n=1 Tax=Paraburkholderia piptadeniae TaxID=1701573 RepID=A0A1N7SP95_9BURK|nr:hypothetical protein BN2476_680042 [Paraburkholderia piptadeniae]
MRRSGFGRSAALYAGSLQSRLTSAPAVCNYLYILFGKCILCVDVVRQAVSRLIQSKAWYETWSVDLTATCPAQLVRPL